MKKRFGAQVKSVTLLSGPELRFKSLAVEGKVLSERDVAQAMPAPPARVKGHVGVILVLADNGHVDGKAPILNEGMDLVLQKPCCDSFFVLALLPNARNLLILAKRTT